jgi:hypothetical protein
MNVVTVDNLVRLLRWHGWIPLLSIVVGGFIRLSKSDAKVAWFPNYIKPENRPIWALGVSLVAGSLEQIFAGGSALEAVVGGIIAANTAIGGHEIFSKVAKKIRDRRTMPPPAPPWEDDSLRPAPPPNVPPMFPTKLVGLAKPFVFVFFLALGFACAYRQAVCQVIDLASEVCPLILVKLPDGGTEQVPKEEVAALAARVGAARARADAGTRPPVEPNPYIRDGGAE